MSKAKKCDRCGSFYSLEQDCRITIDDYALGKSCGSEICVMDLCPDCCSELMGFLNDDQYIKKENVKNETI